VQGPPVELQPALALPGRDDVARHDDRNKSPRFNEIILPRDPAELDRASFKPLEEVGPDGPYQPGLPSKKVIQSG
jgi:hypothetical protein